MPADPGMPIGRPICAPPVPMPNPAPPAAGAPPSGLMPGEEGLLLALAGPLAPSVPGNGVVLIG